MGKTIYSGGEVSDAALSIVGTGNTLQQDKSVQMQDSAKIVSGDNAELGIGATMMDNNAQLGGYRLGDNSSVLLQSMDSNTRDLLLSAFNTLGQNADNMMSLSAGRDANLDLPNETSEIVATVAANPISAFIKNNAKAIAVSAALAVGAWLLWRKKK